MTFDEAIVELKQNRVFKDSVAEGFALDIIDQLQEEYAPTVEMTKEQYIGLLFKGKGRETPHKNFVFMKDVQKLNEKQVSITSIMNAFVHPETIKIIGDENE